MVEMSSGDRLAHPVARAFWTALVAGAGEVLRDVHHTNAAFAAYLPGRTLIGSGAQLIGELLGGLYSQPTQLLHWSAREFQAGSETVGIDIEAEWSPRDASAPVRRRHWLQIDSGRVNRHLALSARPTSAPFPSVAPGPQLERLLASAVDRRRVSSGYGSAHLERLTTRAGEILFIKYLSRSTDWHMRATADEGREALLWLNGDLDRMPASIGHGVVLAEATDDGWAVVTRDVSSWLMKGRFSISGIHAHLAALRDLHQTFWPNPPQNLASISARWGLWWPPTIAAEFHEVDLQPKQVARGWDVLDQAVDKDVAALVRSVVANPEPIIGQLVGPGSTLLHGDAHAGNTALVEGRTVLVDWSLATAGPSAVELAWLANFAQQYSFTVDEMLEACRHLWGAHHDEQALELALVGQASAVIPALAVSLDYPEPEQRELTRRKLRWWSDTARRCARRP